MVWGASLNPGGLIFHLPATGMKVEEESLTSFCIDVEYGTNLNKGDGALSSLGTFGNIVCQENIETAGMPLTLNRMTEIHF